VLRDAIAAACFEFGVRTVDWPAPTYCWPPNEDADVAGQLCAIVEAWVRAADDHERHRLAGPLRGPQQTSVSLDGVLVGATAGEITEYDLDTPTTDHDLSRGEGRGEYAPIQRRLNYDGATRTRIGDPIPAAAPFVYPGFLRPDGKAVAVTVRDGVAVWNIDPERLADAACELADRNPHRQGVADIPRRTWRLSQHVPPNEHLAIAGENSTRGAVARLACRAYDFHTVSERLTPCLRDARSGRAAGAPHLSAESMRCIGTTTGRSSTPSLAMRDFR